MTTVKRGRKEKKIPYQVIVSFAFEYNFTKKEVDEGTEIPSDDVRERVIQMLNDKDYSIEEHEL